MASSDKLMEDLLVGAAAGAVFGVITTLLSINFGTFIEMILAQTLFTDYYLQGLSGTPVDPIISRGVMLVSSVIGLVIALILGSVSGLFFGLVFGLIYILFYDRLPGSTPTKKGLFVGALWWFLAFLFGIFLGGWIMYFGVGDIGGDLSMISCGMFMLDTFISLVSKLVYGLLLGLTWSIIRK